MPYRRLNWNSIADPKRKDVFKHADMYLFDVYGILRALPPKDRDGGGGNFTATLALLCVIDGLATKIWPTNSAVPDQEKRFKRLIRCRLPWGTPSKTRWLEKATAADQLYCEFRNPLVHEVADDRPASSRPKHYDEPVIGVWGNIPREMQDIEKIEALGAWNDNWPLLEKPEGAQARPRYKLAVAPLYWAVKKMTEELLAET